jgi:hypothetical protein
MYDLLNFDIQSRGIKSLAEKWKEDHEALRASVWPLEELIAKINAGLDAALALYDEYRFNKVPQDAPPFSYFLLCFELLVSGAKDTVEAAEKVERNYEGGIEGLDRLRHQIPRVIAVIQEDELANRSAFSCGALDYGAEESADREHERS